MPSLNYGSSAYNRANGNLPELLLKNYYVEQAETSEQGVALLSDEGLALSFTAGSGPINGIFCEAGVFNGDIFTVSNTSLFRGTTLLGAIDGTGPVIWAASDDELVVTRGVTAYSYNGTNFAAIVFPDGASVGSVDYINQRFVFTRAGTEKYYWSNVGDGRTVGALAFSSAERKPDPLKQIRALGDVVWLLGSSSIEPASYDSGDASLVFKRIENVTFDKGVRDAGCTVRADNTLFFIGTDAVLYRIGEAPQRVSNHSIEEKITASVTASLFAYKYEGHEFVCVRLDDRTLRLDLSTNLWSERTSYNKTNWIASCAAMNGDTPVFGHSTTAQVMVIGGWSELGDPLVREFTAATPLDQPLSIDRVHVWANTGQTALLSGQGTDPQIELWSSNDSGNTWDYEGSEDLGPQGEYRTVPEWRALGMFDFPGAMFRLRVSDPVPVRISAVKANDPAGGRAR